VIGVFDFVAIEAFVATIDGLAVLQDGVGAGKSFGKGAGQGFELMEVVTGKEISVGEAPSLERALKQPDAALLLREISKCHGLQ
jgi:hypothetical protein